MMEFDFDADIDEDMFPCIKVIGVGATGAKALSYLKDADTDDVFDTLTISDKNFVVESDPKTYWLFVIADIDDLELAAQVAKSVENYGKNYDGFTLPLITFLILCPSAEDTRLADIPAGFGTWIILPKDKIAATGLTNEALICRAVNMATSIAPGMKKRFTLKGGKKFGYLFGGPDICDVATATGNGGKACIGFGESLDAENNSLQAVKNALKSPLFIEDIRHAKKFCLSSSRDMNLSTRRRYVERQIFYVNFPTPTPKRSLRFCCKQTFTKLPVTVWRRLYLRQNLTSNAPPSKIAARSESVSLIFFD